MYAKPPLEQIVPDPDSKMSQDFNALAGSLKDLEQFTCSATPAHTTVHFLPPTQPHPYPPPHPVGWPMGVFHCISLVNQGVLPFLIYTRLPCFIHKIKKVLTNLVLPPKSGNKDSLHERKKCSSCSSDKIMVGGLG